MIEDILGLNTDVISSLSPAEKEAVIQILKEYSENGTSQEHLNLLYDDYEEIPVDIDTFIEDDEFIGKVTGNGTSIYPFWRKKLRDIFDERNHFEEIIFSGAIGTGKTTTAVTAMCYILYRLLCLKNPLKYYGLQSNSTIVFSFFNTTLDLSHGVAFGKMQSMLMESPWFLKHGKVYGREDKNKYYEPDPEKRVKFKVGSNATHGLGQDIFCLTGDTKIVTTSGEFRIDEISNNFVSVIGISDSELLQGSVPAFVCKTYESNDLYEIELEDGTKIKCSENHKLLLSNGNYIEAKDLCVNDDIMFIDKMNL